VRRTPSVVAAGLLAAAAVVLAGCTNSSSDNAASSAGGSTHHSGTASRPAQPKLVVHPMRAIDLASAEAAKAGSAHVDGRMLLSIDPSAYGVTGSPQSAVVRFTADEQWSPRLRARMQMTGLPGLTSTTDPSLTLLMTGTRLYLHVPGLARQLGKSWVVLDLAALGRQAGVDIGAILRRAKEFDPKNDLRMLRAAGDLRRVGTETIDGTPTTHLAGTVSVRRTLKQLSGAMRSEVKANLQRLGLSKEHVEVWIDAGSRIRRESIALVGKAVSMTIDMTISKYGERVSVSPPPRSKTTDFAALDRLTASRA
jgi:hypothetical protein